MLLDFEIMDLGFTEEDIAEISNHFECNLTIVDWEDIMLFENDEAIFKHLFIEDQTNEAIIETLLEMGEVSAEDLADGQTVMDYMIDNGDEIIFKLPNGRWAIFTYELLRKEALQQMD
ncbi:hypothetical protein [Bacillus hominis]|uniref:hypothetical protein n=1 Tax=Bacillus hominis TaxID=2817478 RepID=UPI001BB33DB0|nr:hypothetical protein [Bacillus hominis]